MIIGYVYQFGIQQSHSHATSSIAHNGTNIKNNGKETTLTMKYTTMY